MDIRACAVVLVMVFTCAAYAAAQEIPPASLTPAAATQEDPFAQIHVMPAGPPETPPASAPAAASTEEASPAQASPAPAAAAVPKKAPAAPPASASVAAPAGEAAPSPAPAAAVPKEAPAAQSPAVPSSGRTIVKFKNRSIMPCRIVRETATEITVESEGVQFPLIREEIEYYGDAAKCPAVSPGEVVAEGAPAAVDSFKPAVNFSAPPGAPTEAPRVSTREERFRAYQRKPTPGRSSAGPAPASSVPSSRISLAALNADPSRYQGQKIVFPQVTLGVLQAHQGYCGLEILPAETRKGSKHRGGSSPDLTTRGVAFVLTEAQAKDLREHSKQYDRARVEFTIEPRVVEGTRYWVAVVTRLDVLRGKGSEIAWTMW